VAYNDEYLAGASALFNSCFPEQAGSADWFEHYQLFSGEVLRTWLVVRNEDDKVVGMVTAGHSRNSAHKGPHIHRLAVDPAFRQQGLGRALVRRAMGYLTGLGYTNIWAVLGPVGPANVKLAQEFGFEEVQ
jgi:ribosomal protein S18 acetylase RimI-like enzyme